MERRQDVDGGLVQGQGIGALFDQAREHALAQVLHHRQAGLDVEGGHLGRRQAKASQVQAGGDEGVHAAGRQPGLRIVAGAGALGGAGVGVAWRALHARRRVH